MGYTQAAQVVKQGHGLLPQPAPSSQVPGVHGSAGLLTQKASPRPVGPNNPGFVLKGFCP